jgi:hypothetical protein
MCHGNKLGAAGVRRSKVIIFSPSENWQAGALWLENSHKKYVVATAIMVPYGAGRCC